MKKPLKIPKTLTDIFVPCLSKEEAICFHDEFITFLRNKVYPIGTPMEKHHIIPLHAGGDNSPENIIRISPEDHVAAHFYRHQAFGEIGDKVAYEMRIADTNELAMLRAQAAVAANREKKNLFWDRDWQALQGRKGGSKGGSRNTPEQRKARQTVGLVWGRIVGISNQSLILQSMLAQPLEWEFQPDKTLHTTPPVESAAALVKALEKIKPGRITGKSTIYKILDGTRKSINGWRLISKVIRSEADKN